MTTVKTINQHGAIYTISGMGNRSYRVRCTALGTGDRVYNVDYVFDSIEAAEAHIRSNERSDALSERFYSRG